MSTVVIAQLLYLEAQSVDKPIYMYINSPGGVVTAGLAIYDTMQYVKPPIATLCVGQACSMGSLLLTAGEPGMRRALPNARELQEAKDAAEWARATGEKRLKEGLALQRYRRRESNPGPSTTRIRWTAVRLPVLAGPPWPSTPRRCSRSTTQCR